MEGGALSDMSLKRLFGLRSANLENDSFAEKTVSLSSSDSIRRPDWILLVATVALMVIGVMFIYSARMVSESHLSWYQTNAFRQCIWYLIGTGLAVGICVFDYKTLCRFSFIAYWGAIFILILVLIPHVGTYRFGARRWIDLGILQFQPSEFAKLAYLFALANYLEKPKEELRSYRVFLRAMSMMGLPFLLILAEPDLGSALVFIPSGLIVMYVADVPIRYLAKVAGIGFLLISLLVIDVVFAPEGWRLPLEDYQKRRLLVYFNQSYVNEKTPPEDRQRLAQLEEADSYNIEQALISVGSGGFIGKGWKEGTQTSLGFLPRAVAHNDFIFSVIAEETGFLGSSIVIGLYGIIFFAGLRTATQARERMGRLLAVGTVTLLFSHVMINIGMNIRLMPVTGIPLPLLSYGGSSVICSLLAIGILQSISIYRRKYN